MKVYGVIYVITNLLTGMKYVGQTTRSVKVRFEEHIRRKDTLIGQNMHICGRENFTIEVLEECKTQEELNACEISWIARFNCIFPYGYNITAGGAHKHSKVRAKRGSKQNVLLEKKFHTCRKWNAYPILEAELQKRFITDAKLADVLSLKKAEVARKMKGKHNFSLEQMSKIKEFLGVDIPLEELFRRNPEINFPGEPYSRHWETFPILEAELKKQGIKAAQLAELLGMSIQSVGRRMKGLIKLLPAHMEKIRNFLGVEMTVEELFRHAE
ncbi:MAG: helix-turn-helix domain-containing protein [Selenomonadaceae bacterium]|nr:helix-turn-helix domain-containing protein [Selenomonadaceae bacterium]